MFSVKLVRTLLISINNISKQARAKIEMREIATERDALDVVEIVKYSLVDTFSDEYDTLDFKRSQNGSGMSQRNKVR